MNKILSQKDLYEILPFGKTKILQLISSGELPMVKIGKDYIMTEKMGSSGVPVGKIRGRNAR